MNNSKQKRVLKGLHNKVFDRPLLITQQALNPIVDYMLNPERGVAKDLEIPIPPQRLDFDSDQDYMSVMADFYDVDLENKIGYLNISGTLVNKAGQIESCVELVSYESLVNQFSIQVALGIEKCVMTFDSGGGEAYRCFASASLVRKMADDNNVKLLAYIDGLSASASYAWSCVAHEVISNPQSQVGSIGVVVQLYNDSQYLEKLGVERSFVFAGDNKIPFDKDGKFTESFIENIQASVNKTYNGFVNHVSSFTGLSTEAIRNTKANVFDADTALELGLIDKVMEIEDFNSYIKSNLPEPAVDSGLKQSDDNGDDFNSFPEQNLGVSNPDINLNTESPTKQGKPMENVEQLQLKLNELKNEKASLASEVASLNTELKNAVLAKEKAEGDLAKAFLEQKEAKRKEMLVGIFGTESAKVGEYTKMFASLDDKAFNALAQELSNGRQEAKQDMSEKGHDKKEQPIELSQEESLKKRAEARGNRYTQGAK